MSRVWCPQCGSGPYAWSDDPDDRGALCESCGWAWDESGGWYVGETADD